MTFEPNLIQYPFTESTDTPFTPGLLFPLPQHTYAPPPELFDQEFAEVDLNLPYEQSDEFFTAFRNFSPDISSPPVSTPLTYSTICVYGATSSHHSSDFAPGYLMPSDIEGYYSLNNGLHGTHDSIHSAIFPNGPPPRPAEAQFDFGTPFFSPNFFGISPEDSSTATQPPSSPLPIHPVTPDLETQAQMARAPDRSFKCPHSPHCKKETI